MNKQYKIEELKKKFNKQIETLKSRGCPKEIVKMFDSRQGSIVIKANNMTFAEGNIPFLPVIPRAYLSIYSQMLMVRYKDKVGHTRLDPNKITDAIEIPDKPYYIFDVENGNGTLHKSPGEAKKLIEEQGRRYLADVEVISLCLHTDVLSKHHVYAIGSHFGDYDGILDLWLDDDGPELLWSFFGSTDTQHGSASCNG